MVKQFVRDGNFAFTFEATRVEVARSGDYGYVQGSYTLTMTDAATKKPFTDRGSYLRIYRKQLDGAWKVSGRCAPAACPPACRSCRQWAGWLPARRLATAAAPDFALLRRACKRQRMGVDIVQAYAAEISTERTTGTVEARIRRSRHWRTR